MPFAGLDESTWYPEDTILKDEMTGPHRSVLRIAVSFAFLSRGEVIELDKDLASYNRYIYADEEIELVAAVANGLNLQGMFSQAVWFGEGGAEWKWMRIKDIEFITYSEDSVFRAGTEPCIVVGTSMGPYYLTIPHPDYQVTWENSLKTVWPTKKIDIKVWPLEGRRPLWWFDDYEDEWPFDKSEGDRPRGTVPLYPGRGEERVLPFRDTLAQTGPGLYGI